MSGPLAGLRVADFSQLVQGPFATQILADFGADVIKIEPPGGDWLRGFAIADFYLGGESISFLAFNRNKRSVVIDLKRPAGREVALRIIEDVDVVVENFRPGVMERLGLGYEELARRNSRLVYCASTGYGRVGPYSARPGQDLLAQAVSGWTWLNGRSSDPPQATGLGIADLTAGHQIVIGVLAALISRESSGRGQRVDVNLMSALLELQGQELAVFMNGGPSPARSEAGIAGPYNGAPYGIYPTADGYLAIAMNPISKLASVLGVDGLESGSNIVMGDRDTIKRTLEASIATRRTEDLLGDLVAADLWAAPVQGYAEVERDPQVAAVGILTSYEHPTAQTVRVVGPTIAFSATPAEIARPAPRLGQHTDEVLAEFALSAAERKSLRSAEAIR